MTVFTIVVGVIQSLATVAAVVYAWKASRASAEATAQAQQSLEYARQTVEIAAAAHEADERARKLRQLLDIAALAERIFWEATGKAQPTAWRCREQNDLGQLLKGTSAALPECERLVGESQEHAVMHKASEAREEVARAIEALTR